LIHSIIFLKLLKIKNVSIISLKYLNIHILIFIKYVIQNDLYKKGTKVFHIILELDKEARAWDLYARVEAQVKNMISSLRAVSELQNPAIKNRHWQELMAKTQVCK